MMQLGLSGALGCRFHPQPGKVVKGQQITTALGLIPDPAATGWPKKRKETTTKKKKTVNKGIGRK